MKTSLFSVVFLVTIIFNSYSMEEEAKYTYDFKGLLIFLDDSETNIGAISSSLITALNQDAGPIIVSASLVKNIFPRYEKPSEPETLSNLFNRFQQVREEAKKGNTSAQKEEKYIFLKALRFDAKKWLIKKINDALYLFIPNSYLLKMNINIDAAKKYDLNQISGTELRLGLKVNHMKTTNIQEIINQPLQSYEYADYFIKALYDERANASTIFCTHSDYKNRRVTLPAWSIYIEGHGNIQKSITHLSLKTFRKKFLKFLENKINTRLLMYRSCYAAGLNNEIIYRDVKTAVHKTYSFAIITQALTDASVEDNINLLFDNSGKLTLKSYDNFARFLTVATSSEVMDYQKITETIFPLLPAKGIAWGTVPQIKLPGIEWFSVLASDKDIISIGSIFAKTRDSQQSLDVVRYFKTDPKAILLYAEDIPFELVINSHNLEAIISMVPGEAFHRIKRIISVTKSRDELIKWFMAVKMLGAQKIFFIERMNDIDNVIIYHNRLPGLPLFGRGPTYESYAFFEKDGLLYVYTPGSLVQVLKDEELKKMYIQLLAKAQKKMPSEVGITKQKGIITTQEIENLKKVIAEKIKKGPLEFKQEREANKDQFLKQSLEELQRSLMKLQSIL